MVPAKDTRAILHELYRSRYIDLFQLSTSHSSKQHYNPSTSIYLWCVHQDRLRSKVIDDVLTATRNLRLRRQHESEVVGREWIERAQRQTYEDENEHETDKINQQKFELGLERIDGALQQLDETLLALSDF
jgi:transcription initiation factor IIE alpha subunit